MIAINNNTFGLVARDKQCGFFRCWSTRPRSKRERWTNWDDWGLWGCSLHHTATETAWICWMVTRWGQKFVCVCVCAWRHLFEGANAFKRIQMRNRENGGAVLYAAAALEGFVCLLVCVCVWCLHAHLPVRAVFLSTCVTQWGWCQVQCRWAADRRDEKVYKINTPDLIGSEQNGWLPSFK